MGFPLTPLVSVEICSSVVGVVSRPLAAGLRQFDTRRRFIISPVTAAVNDEHRCTAHAVRSNSLGISRHLLCFGGNNS